MDSPFPSPGRCCWQVSVRDTLRRCGGKRHFRMHYTRRQCRRKPVDGGRYCWQHEPWERAGRMLERKGEYAE